MSSSMISISWPSCERQAMRSPCWYRLLTAHALTGARLLFHTTGEGSWLGLSDLLMAVLMLSASTDAGSPEAPANSSPNTNPLMEASSMGARVDPLAKRYSNLQSFLFLRLKTQTEPCSSATRIREACWLSMAVAATRPSNLGHSTCLTSCLSSSTKPHSVPARKSRLPKWASRPSTAAPGVAVASILARRVPFLVKTLILPSTSPATKYFEPCCEATARAVTRGASPSLPGGTCICLCSVAVTLTTEPRNCETFSSVEFRRAYLWSFVKRLCRTATLCTRMTPPASPVASMYSSCEGETVR
mmetsp:Transcript_108658/g.324975  ORF Transcript_108658/g.324975 Transcript_108658/m.324975 type:complete len:302 (-) Transcript_108658:691-1596(-)